MAENIFDEFAKRLYKKPYDELTAFQKMKVMEAVQKYMAEMQKRIAEIREKEVPTLEKELEKTRRERVKLEEKLRKLREKEKTLERQIALAKGIKITKRKGRTMRVVERVPSFWKWLYLMPIGTTFTATEAARENGFASVGHVLVEIHKAQSMGFVEGLGAPTKSGFRGGPYRKIKEIPESYLITRHVKPEEIEELKRMKKK